MLKYPTGIMSFYFNQKLFPAEYLLPYNGVIPNDIFSSSNFPAIVFDLMLYRDYIAVFLFVYVSVNTPCLFVIILLCLVGVSRSLNAVYCCAAKCHTVFVSQVLLES